MLEIRRHRTTGILILSLIALLSVEGWQVRRSAASASAARRAVDLKRTELERMLSHTPSLDEETARMIAVDAVTAEKLRDDLRERFTGEWSRFEGVPASSVDAFLDLTAFVSRARSLAGKHGVATRSAESFGFSAYTSSGPEFAEIAQVFRQRVAAEHLIGMLVESHPHALLGVARRPPEGAGSRTSEDFFDDDLTLGIDPPSGMDVEAFRVEFAGRTPVLRSFLNQLAASAIPAFVHDIKVEPLGRVGWLPAEPSEGAGLSRFKVIVEFLVPPMGPAASR